MKASLKAYLFLIAVGLLIFGIFISRGTFKRSRNALDVISTDIEAHDKPLGAPDSKPLPPSVQAAATQPAPTPAAAPTPNPTYTPESSLGAAVQSIRKKSEANNQQLEKALNGQ